MMTKRVKIAHISDLHFSGKQDRRQLDAFDRLLNHFNTVGVDHLVISGDLSHNADQGDWQLVKDKLESHALFHWDKCTVIAGNHDVINLEEEMRFYNALNPLPLLRQKAFARKLADFSLFFQELITGEKGVNKAFPFVKIINFPSVKIALTALNSVYPWYPADNPLGARGSITAGQLRALSHENVLASLRECFVIGLCHHAYRVYGTDSLIDQAFDWTMELKNRDEFLVAMKVIKARIVLHGHFHRFQSYSVEGITFINGGSFRYSPQQYSELLIGREGGIEQKFLSLP
ncbi:MAG: metallophosphoesterase [Chlorobium sp.]|nr:MAG: metallophosphoesterase [Chlorobium sp.]